MIDLEKHPAPQILQQRATEWTTDLLAAIAAGADKDSHWGRYRHDQVKEALARETHDKCAYCESKVRHVAFEHIEHMQPKKHNPRLCFEWLNLTLACPVCNNSKGDFPGATGQTPLLNPYTDRPEKRFRAEGILLWHSAAGDNQAEATRVQLDLNRAELLERRGARAEQVLQLVDRWSTETDPALKAAFHTQLRREAGSDREYALVTRSLLKSRGVI